MTEPNTGLLLFIPYRYLENAVFDAVRAAGYDDLTMAQSRIFQRISEKGSRATDLAEQAQVTKQTAGFLVDQLERAGYVRRVADPVDARARLVEVTQRGKDASSVAAAALAAVEAQWEAKLGPRRMRALRAALLELVEITDPFGGPPSPASSE